MNSQRKINKVEKKIKLEKKSRKENFQKETQPISIFHKK